MGQLDIWNSKGTGTLNGEHGKGSTGESNFLCSKYNDRDDVVVDDTNSWGGNHTCGTREMNAMGDTWGYSWTSDIHGIQGRLIAQYSEQK